MVNPLHPLAPFAGWLFNEGKGSQVWDIGGHGNHGTLMNMTPATDWVGGKFGWALDFDGVNNYVSIPDSDNLSFGDGSSDYPFTVSGWIRMNDATRFTIIGKRPSSTSREWLFYVDAIGIFRLLLTDESTGGYVYQNGSIITSYEGEWIHVAGVYDGRGGASAADGIVLYLNGQAEAPAPAGSSAYVAMENLATDVWIARYDNEEANGLIDHVLIYNRALTAGEVAWLYHDPFCFMAQPSAVMKWVAVAGLSIPVAMRYYRNRRAA